MSNSLAAVLYMRGTSKHRSGSTMSRTEWLLHLATGLMAD